MSFKILKFSTNWTLKFSNLAKLFSFILYENEFKNATELGKLYKNTLADLWENLVFCHLLHDIIICIVTNWYYGNISIYAGDL
jgi:hypothetical protein